MTPETERAVEGFLRKWPWHDGEEEFKKDLLALMAKERADAWREAAKELGSDAAIIIADFLDKAEELEKGAE